MIKIEKIILNFKKIRTTSENNTKFKKLRTTRENNTNYKKILKKRK